MSLIGPNVFLGIGNSDSWSILNRFEDVAIDSRMLTARYDSVSAAGIVISSGSRTIANDEAWYFELQFINIQGNCRAGIIMDTARNFSMSTLAGGGGVAGDTGYGVGIGQIYLFGSSNVMGLPTMTAGQRLGVRVRGVSGSPRVQYYIDGVAAGSEQTPSGTSVNAWVCFFGQSNGSEATLIVDRDDLRFLPDGSQAWGAAARVADAGGYTPPNSLWGTAASGITFDAYLRTATMTLNSANAVNANTPNISASKDYLYVEFRINTVDAGGGTSSYGVCARANSVAQAAGNGLVSWVYQRTGQVRNNSTSSGSYPTLAAGDYPGFILHVPTGRGWPTKNGVPIAGNPLTLSGALWSNILGDIVPTCSPGGNATTLGRVRLATHAKEQVYRPSYCQAWNGADLLPEQHYRSTLMNDAEITQGIWIPVPWGGSKDSGSPVGAIEIRNDRGYYNSLRNVQLRDQFLTIAEFETSARLDYVAKVVCDSREFDDENNLRILSRGNDAFLDKTINKDIVAIGDLHRVPVQVIGNGSSNAYNIAHTHYLYGEFVSFGEYDRFGITDAGAQVSSFNPGNVTNVQGFVRTVAVSGKQSAENFRVFRKGTNFTLANADFTAWGGSPSLPTSWVATQNGTTSTITQSPTGSARMVEQVGAPTAILKQSLGFTVPGVFDYACEIDVSAYVSGDLTADIVRDSDNFQRITLAKNFGVTGVGTYFLILSRTTTDGVSATGAFRLKTTEPCDVSVSEVRVFPIVFVSKYEYLLKDLGGFTAFQVEETLINGSGTSQGSGYWSNKKPKYREILDDFVQSDFGDYFNLKDGRLAIRFLTHPEDIGLTSAATLEANDIIGRFHSREDRAPSLSDGLVYNRNYAIHTETEVAGGVTASVRAALLAEYSVSRLSQHATVPALKYHPYYSHAVNAAPMPSVSVDVTPSSDTRLTLFKSRYDRQRNFNEAEYANAAVRHLLPGDLVLQKAREGALPAAGAKVFIIKKTRTIRNPKFKVLTWG